MREVMCTTAEVQEIVSRAEERFERQIKELEERQDKKWFNSHNTVSANVSQFQKDLNAFNTKIDKIVREAFFKTVGKWIIGGGVVIIIAILSSWYSLYFQVQKNSEELESRKSFTDEGKLIMFQIQQNSKSIEAINEKLEDIKTAIK